MKETWAASKKLNPTDEDALPGSWYQDAMTAHGADQWISCEGDLVRQGALTVL